MSELKDSPKIGMDDCPICKKKYNADTFSYAGNVPFCDECLQKYLYSQLTNKKHAFSDQIDGTHYKNLKIQPVEFIHANNIPFLEVNVIKYIVRWREKGGLKDLKKAKHYIDLIIEMENLNARETN